MPSPTPSQKAAINYFEGDSAVMAAAGSGKTFVLVEKVATLISHGVKLENILISTFTKKAGEEIRERVGQRLKLSPKQKSLLRADTLHGIAAELLRENKRHQNFQILEGAFSRLEIIRTVRENLLRLAEEHSPEAVAGIERFDFHPAVHFFTDLLSKKHKITENFPYFKLLSELDRIYTEKKREKNLLDFQDLETELLQLLSNASILEFYQKKFQWIIIDEFQDINPVQWQILSRLHDPLKNKLVIVGDPRQSIYRFRGADPSLFSRVTQEIQNHGGKLFHLNENFRSSPEIISFVNQMNTTLFSESYPSLVPTKEDLKGKVETFLLQKGNADHSRQEEAHWVTHKILSLKKEGWENNSFCVLVRTRNIIPYFEEIFQKSDIPYETSDGTSLLEQPEILSILFFLKQILLPEDSFLREGLSHSPLAALKIDDFPQNPWEEFISKIFENSLPLFHHPKSIAHVKAFKELVHQLETLGVSNLSSLIETIEALRHEKALIPSPTEVSSKNAVKLMTVHGSKGLEFPIVFLCDIAGRRRSSQRFFVKNEKGEIILKDNTESQGLKHKMTKSSLFEELEEKEKAEEEAESARLLYVAITRPIRYLFLPLPPPPKTKARKKEWAQSLHENFGY